MGRRPPYRRHPNKLERTVELLGLYTITYQQYRHQYGQDIHYLLPETISPGKKVELVPEWHDLFRSGFHRRHDSDLCPIVYTNGRTLEICAGCIVLVRRVNVKRWYYQWRYVHLLP